LPEGYCNVPDWMNDVSAAQNKNLPPEVKQLRAFSGTDPSNGKLVQVFFCKADYSLTLQNLKATAAASEEEIKVQFQKFIGQGFSPGITITMENAATDLPEQRMTAILSCSGRGRVFKELSSVVPISNQQILKTEIYVEEPNYTELQMMAQIAASLSAFPQYRLIDTRAVSPLASESQKPSSTPSNLVFAVLALGFLVGVSLLIYYGVRKAIP